MITDHVYQFTRLSFLVFLFSLDTFMIFFALFPLIFSYHKASFSCLSAWEVPYSNIIQDNTKLFVPIQSPSFLLFLPILLLFSMCTCVHDPGSTSSLSKLVLYLVNLSTQFFITWGSCFSLSFPPTSSQKLQFLILSLGCSVISPWVSLHPDWLLICSAFFCNWLFIPKGASQAFLHS